MSKRKKPPFTKQATHCWHDAAQCDPVYKATIIPRGGALGMVVSLPEIDRLNWHKIRMRQKLAMTMAGKAAEILKYGEDHVSNGPAVIFMQASQSGPGHGAALGHVRQGRQYRLFRGRRWLYRQYGRFLGLGQYQGTDRGGYEKALEILKERNTEWERLAEGLLEYETLTGEEIKRVMAGEPPNSGDDEDGTPDNGTAPSVTAIPKTKPRTPPGEGGMEPEPT